MLKIYMLNFEVNKIIILLQLQFFMFQCFRLIIIIIRNLDFQYIYLLLHLMQFLPIILQIHLINHHHLRFLN